MYRHADQSFLRRPAVMSDSVFDRVLDRAASYCGSRAGRTLAVHFHGGEPMLMPAKTFDRLAYRAAQRLGDSLEGLFLQTNATLVDDAWVSVLQRHRVAVSVSVDGPASVHDRSRVDHAGRGSYERAVMGLRRLADENLLAKVLCVIDPTALGSEVYAHLRSLGMRRMNFLLPDATHDSWPALYGANRLGALGDFLITAFDAWYAEDDPNVHVILFEELLRSLMGGFAVTDAIGGAIPDYVVIDTDGSIQANDVLKVCDEGVADSGLTVLQHDFDDEGSARALFKTLITGGMTLPDVCRRCGEREVCGGGYLPHRYSRANGFDNPSVWCADLLAWISHVRAAIENDAVQMGTGY
jgi:uncharacterized protein